MLNYLKYFFIKINKKNVIGIKSGSGRNYLGTICVRHKFGGIKNKYRHIDFYRRINNYGYVYKILTDVYRTANIGGIIYSNGLFAYIILSENISLGKLIFSGINNENDTVGYTLLLNNVKLFSIINNIELYPNKGFSLSRAAGSSCILTSMQDKDTVTLKLKSGWNIFLSKKCLASSGCVSNVKHKFNNLKKAGISWALGNRPSVRGVAMNPCDHPHGGGEGKKSPPSAQKSPWGWFTKGTASLKKKYERKKKKLYKNIK